jgi:uncharacterized protein (DUF433 family)
VFATAGREIYFRLPDGTWSGNSQPDQIVFHTIIPMEPIYRRIRAATRRPRQTHGRIERRRGTHGSKPVFAGTRLPVQTVLDWLKQGFEPARVLEEYPDLVPADILAARKYARALGAIRPRPLHERISCEDAATAGPSLRPRWRSWPGVGQR